MLPTLELPQSEISPSQPDQLPRSSFDAVQAAENLDGTRDVSCLPASDRFQFGRYPVEAAMNAWNNGTPMLTSSGYVAQVDEDLCAACGFSADYCQFGPITVDNGYAVVDYEACMGCGVCVSQCPEGAVSLVRDSVKGEPLEIQKLTASTAESSQG